MKICGVVFELRFSHLGGSRVAFFGHPILDDKSKEEREDALIILACVGSLRVSV